MSTWPHEVPDRKAIKVNRDLEPDGERIRSALERFLKKHKIVGIMLDTDLHTVDIQSAKLPPRIKNVLTQWGSIYVSDEREVETL